MKIKSRRRDVTLEGKLIFIFPANKKPNLDDVVEYYFQGNREEAMESKHLPTMMGTIKVDRYVLKKPNGFNIIVPINPEVVTIIDSDIDCLEVD